MEDTIQTGIDSLDCSRQCMGLYGSSPSIHTHANGKFTDSMSTKLTTQWILSDRAIPRSFRMMQGFGVHTFRLINAEGKSTFVKYHWTPHLGTHSLVWDEALKLAGQDPDFHRRDLWDAIEAGAYPKWELGVQLIKEEDEHKFDFDLLDSTKVNRREEVLLSPDYPRGSRPRTEHWYPYPQCQPGRLLYRGRASRILYSAHRTRNGLLV